MDIWETIRTDPRYLKAVEEAKDMDDETMDEDGYTPAYHHVNDAFWAIYSELKAKDQSA